MLAVFMREPTVTPGSASEELLIAVEHAITLASAEGVAFGFFEILVHHLADERREADLRRPTELVARLGGIAEEGFHLGWAEVARVNGDDALPGVGIAALPLDAGALPADLETDSPRRRR